MHGIIKNWRHYLVGVGQNRWLERLDVNIVVVGMW
jgi:hypothetical protein